MSLPLRVRDTAPSRLSYAVVAIVFLAVGIGSVIGFDALTGRSGSAPAAAPAAASDTDEPAAIPVTAPARIIDAPSGPAKTPAAAVAQFLAAEQRGDYRRSYALLTAENREAVGSPEQWVGDHAQIPRVAGWQPGEVVDNGGTALVTGTVAFEPVLDEVMGLVPAAAVAGWEAVSAGGTWFVDFDGSTLQPQYAADDTAADAARQWAEARSRCESAPQYDGGLVGTRRLADELCESGGDIEVAEARELEVAELDLLLPEFGADAEVWARAVDVDGDVPLTAVLAPLGEQWLVVGLVPR